MTAIYMVTSGIASHRTVRQPSTHNQPLIITTSRSEKNEKKKKLGPVRGCRGIGNHQQYIVWSTLATPRSDWPSISIIHPSLAFLLSSLLFTSNHSPLLSLLPHTLSLHSYPQPPPSLLLCTSNFSCCILVSFHSHCEPLCK